MAKSKKTQAEEDSFYDAFLTSTEQPAVATVDDPSISVPVAPDPPVDDTPIMTRAARKPSRRAVATPPETAPPAQTRAQPVNNGKGIGRRSDPDYMQASAYVPRQLRRQVERALLNDPDERDYSQLIEELLQKWLTEQKDYA